MARLRQRFRLLHRAIYSARQTGIHYITDGQNWAFDWVARYLTTEISRQFNIPAQTGLDAAGFRRQIIHFGDRYTYLDGTFRRIHPSNQVFLTWFHGTPDSFTGAMPPLFANLLESIPYVEQIVVSCSTAQQVLIRLGVDRAKITLIPLGVDLPGFQPPAPPARANIRRALGIPLDAFCIGSFQKDGVGWQDGLEPKLIKGPDIFLQVIEQLAARYPNLFVLLTGPSRGYVKRGLDQLGVPYIHHYLENYHDIIPYYHALDLYLITSRDEGGPIALLESWATGVPVVSTQMGMPADLIRHRENGMLANVEDVQQLTDHAIELIENRDLREFCRNSALVDVAQYSWPKIAGHYYEKLYRSILQDSAKL